VPERLASGRERDVLGEAARAVVAGRNSLALSRRDGEAVERGCAIVDSVAVVLADLAAGEDHHGVRSTLLRWRDHLSSHVFAARALLDVEVDDELAAHMLERGLAELVGG